MAWKTKTVDAKMNIDAKIPGERLMLAVTAVLAQEGTGKEVTIPFTIESKELMDKTLISIENRMNKTQDDFEVTPNGEAYEPKLPEVQVAPTPSVEEVAFAKAKAEWTEKDRRLAAFMERAERAKSLGLTPSEDLMNQMKALGQDVMDTFNPSYVD